jgi:hypothetical protein
MAGKVESVALVLSVLSLGFSGYVFYYTEMRGPNIHVAVGHDVLITKTMNIGPRIGVTCSFVNDGAHQSIITDAELDLDSPKKTLHLSNVSQTFGEWVEDNGVFKPSPNKFTLPVWSKNSS